MDTLVFVLAAGKMGDESYSWRHETPRHSLLIAGEPLIRRTVRLVRRFGYDTTTVTKSAHIKAMVRNVFEPENDHLIYDTMLSTRGLWEGADRVVFIQGDFLLYEDFLKLVFESEGSCVWEADHGPPAVMFRRDVYDLAEEKLKHLSSIHVLHQDCLQYVKGFTLRIFRYREKSLYDFDNTKIWELCLREQPWVSEKPKPVLLFLAAGRAKRLKPFSDETPKALIEFGGLTLAERMIDEFTREGVGEIIVTVGHFHERVENCLGASRNGVPIRYLFNPSHETTGSGTSVTLARDFLRGCRCYVFEGDQILSPHLIKKLVKSPFMDCLLVDGEPDAGNDPGVAAVGGNLVEKVVWPAGKAESRDDFLGNSPLFLKLSHAATEIFTEFEDDGCVESINEVAKRFPLHPVSTGDLPWAHINTPKGLDYAQNVVFPRIEPRESQQEREDNNG